MRSLRRILASALLALAALPSGRSRADQRGIVDGPTAVELRAHASSTAPVAASVAPGVAFSFAPDDDGEWAELTLAGGGSGWLPLAAVRLFFDESALPHEDGSDLSEIARAARARGFDYATAARRAARGDATALRRLFALADEADGGAAESITGVPTVVYHLLGDAKFAAFVAAEPVASQVVVRNVVLRDGRLPPTTLYLQRHFPETAAILFPHEIVAWPSPNGRYAIRKVFSDPFDPTRAKVVRAELVEKPTGRLLLDLGADDIGTGVNREGRVVWSPDSQGFASLSIDLTARPGNLFDTPRPPPLRKRTAVYRRVGGTWRRVDLALDPVPGRERDTELHDAVLGHDYVEPIRWRAANVLELGRHEYYETHRPLVVGGKTFQTIVGLSRSYRITATIDAEGTATLAWKPRAQ